ncbi:high mobility group box domain-containing protein, partial [Mycena rebaudengoi]
MVGPARTSKVKRTQPPRPPNAWIIYRSDKMKEFGKGVPQVQISKLVSALWHNERPEIRVLYEERAEEKKLEHKRLYPDYRFQPVQKAD